ncbi:MAG: glycosyltransferase family 2 protein [Planctomycetota bacterium]
MSGSPELSVVVPVFNEEGSLEPLHSQLVEVLSGTGKRYELIFVDDGSTDGSAAQVERLISNDPATRLVQLRGNYGKSAALAAGFDECRGQVIFTMDADLQDDPKEIPRFLAKLDEGYDLVSGYKKERHDPWHKVYPSRAFNAMVNFVTGVGLHDVNCGFKCYRRPVVEEIDLYGELHRLIPVLAHWRKFRVAEIVVQHHPRRHGVSKFGVERLYRGFMDMLTVAFFLRYGNRPSHLFGKVGFGFGAVGFLACLYLTALWFMGYRPIGNRPLLFLGILLITVGVQFLALGIISELLTRAARRTEKPYAIVRKVQREDRTQENER